MTDPLLALAFLGGDLEAGHLSSQAIGSSFIVRDSVSFKCQLLNGLKSSSNQVELQILQGCPSIEDIIATDGDIKAVLKDGDSIVFTGYISTSLSWSVTASGEKALCICLEDVGTRLLGKSFIQAGSTLLNCTAHEAIQAVCRSAGISVSSLCTQIASTVTRTVDSNITCREILDQMLYELGYVYFFDSLGELRVHKIDCTSTEGLFTLDKNNLAVSNGKAITLSKKIRQYRSARVGFRTLGTASHYLVYRNTSGNNDSHPYCSMELPAGAWLDGTEVYSDSEHHDNEADSFREPALIQACNAEGETALVGSGSIIAVSYVEAVMTATSASVTASVTPAGGAYLEIEAHNPCSLPCSITRLDAYADIVYEKDTCIVRTASIAQEPEQSDSLMKEELVFVHDKALAQAHANLVGQYHRFCNAQYSFSSRIDLALGTSIRLHDNLFSGLDTSVMLIAKSWKDSGEVFSYTAVAISAFSLDADAWIQIIAGGRSNLKGEKGIDGESAYSIVVVSASGDKYRRGDLFSSILTARVFHGGEEITSSCGSRFRWLRHSRDSADDEVWNARHYSLSPGTLAITQDDLNGGTSFEAQYITDSDLS